MVAFSLSAGRALALVSFGETVAYACIAALLIDPLTSAAELVKGLAPFALTVGGYTMLELELATNRTSAVTSHVVVHAYTAFSGLVMVSAFRTWSWSRFAFVCFLFALTGGFTVLHVIENRCPGTFVRTHWGDALVIFASCACTSVFMGPELTNGQLLVPFFSLWGTAYIRSEARRSCC